MKLRNKKTGEVKEFNEIFLTKTVNETNTTASEYVERSYRKIAELNEEWEDYKPKEPLIKDEKIRKAVRAWAEANEETELKVTGGCLVTTFKGLHFQLETEFRCSWTRNGVYTIAELCGEEE